MTTVGENLEPPRAHARHPRRTRWLAGFLAAVLWAPALLLAYEVYLRVTWKHAEETNPFLLASKGAQAWPVPESTEFPAPTLPETEPSNQPLPELTPEQRLARTIRRYAVFNDLNTEERCQFASMYRQFAITLDRAGNIAGSYSFPPPEPIASAFSPGNSASSVAQLVPAAELPVFLAAIGRAFDSGQAAFVQVPWGTAGKSATYETLLLPVRDAPQVGPGTQPGAIAAVIAFVPAGFEPVPGDSPWELPFFRYKAHTTRPIPSQDPALFRTNNFGFRDDDVIVPKPPSIFRIACVGGSTTEEGERNNRTYPNVLEKQFADYFGPGRVDVINCGLSAVGAFEERLRTPDYLELEPGLIVYYNGVNDICRLHLQSWERAAPKWKRFLWRSRVVDRWFNRRFFPSDAEIVAQLEARTFKHLRAICDRAGEQHVAMAFCSFARPDLEHLTADERVFFECNTREQWGGLYVSFPMYCHMVDLFNERIRALCEEKGAMYIPVAENLRGGGNYFGDICHTRDLGLARKTGIIFDALRDYVAQALEKGALP